MAQPQYEIHNAPSDGITAVRLSGRLMAASSWDSKVHIYDLQSNEEKTSYSHKGAVLDCCFADKFHTYSGGLDHQVKMFDITMAGEVVVGSHNKPVKCVDFSQHSNVLITGSWDATIKLWDPRSGKLIGTYAQPDKVFAISHVNEKLVVGTAGRHICIYDMRNMEQPQHVRESSLKFQTRAIKCFPSGIGFVSSSIEGRVAVDFFDLSPEEQAKKYAFKCHRATINGVDTVYPVNTIAFHPVFGTFATGGCDGVVNVWDADNRKRLYQYPKFPTSVSSIAFSEDGLLMAVASSYTFEEGEKDHPPDQIFIRSISEPEVKPKQKLT